jgi:type II secretory pathway pseudopilin PulG
VRLCSPHRLRVHRATPTSSEAGESLVELMITIAIMGTAMVAILGAIWTTLRVADYNSKTSSADIIVRAYAEAMKQGGAESTYHYLPCTVPGGHVTYPEYTPTEPYQDDYTASVVSIEYLDGFDGDQPKWAAACPATDGGLQRITLRVRSNVNVARGDETVVLVKRDATQDLPRCEVIECVEDPS